MPACRISESFFASDYCYKRELKRALERRRQGRTEVVPIILHDVDWQKSIFSGLEALPDQGWPVSSRHWKNQAEALANVARGIRRLVEPLKTRTALEPVQREHVDLVMGQFDDIKGIEHAPRIATPSEASREKVHTTSANPAIRRSTTISVRTTALKFSWLQAIYSSFFPNKNI